MDDLPFSDRAWRTAWRLFPKRAFSSAVGFGAGLAVPASVRRAVLERFARSYGIDASEAEQPLEHYTGIDEFFTRRLRPGARPVDASPDAVVAPSDGVVVASGLATHGQLVQAKGVLFSLADLLGDDALAGRLLGGSYVITYLSPKDYHRVHAPVGDRVVGWRHLPGTLFSVNDRSVEREPGLFVRNERFVTLIEGGAGLCALVMVAAVGVGHVTVSYDDSVATHAATFAKEGAGSRTYDEGRPLAKGDELGIFHLGSTTIAVFEPGRVVLSPLAPGASVRMGERMGRIVSPSKEVV